MISLLSETGQFYLDNITNKYVTFAFRGDEEFLKRTENLLVNCGAVKNTHSINETFSYCLIPLDRLKRALFLNFRAEIVQSKTEHINYVTQQIKDEVGDVVEIQVEWDEDKLEELSNVKVEEFLSSKIIYEDLKIYRDDKPCMGEYKVGYYQDAEPERITE
jgi:hypothetical protein